MKLTILLVLLPIAVHAQQPQGCETRPATRAFDFWVGNWQVTASGTDHIVGSSAVQLINRQCTILENWTGAGGGIGKSLNFYNPSTQKWQQVWTDATGGVTFYSGTYADSAMHFEGERIRPNGQSSPVRLTFTRIDGNHVRQVGGSSTDGGKTWITQYDFLYTRTSN